MYYNVLRYIHWKWGPLRFTVCRQALSVQDPINHVNKIESVKVVWIFLILCEFSRWGNTWVVRVSQLLLNLIHLGLTHTVKPCELWANRQCCDFKEFCG